MINKTKILWIIAFICVLINLLIIYVVYQRTISGYKKQASETFKEALLEELQKRDTIAVFLNSDTKQQLNLEVKMPDSIKVGGEREKKIFKIPQKKWQNSIVNSFFQCTILTPILKESPLNIDSLNMIWKKLNSNLHLPVQTYVRLSTYDWDERVISTCADERLDLISKDSLCSYYMGERCEYEATGFFSYNWWQMFNVLSFVLILLVWLFAFGIYYYLVRRRQLLVTINEINTVNNCLAVHAVTIECQPIYELEEGVFFDKQLQVLRKEDTTENLSPQSTLLLELFIKNDFHTLTRTEIENSLWPEQRVSKEQMHSAISRLRRSLKRVSSIIIKCNVDSYQLIMPHSIEESRLLDYKEED